MQFSLVFLPVGLVVGLLLLIRGDFARSRRRIVAILSVAGGFLAMTCLIWGISGTNPFGIWLLNQRNHARFYVEYPRTYRLWVVANLVEFAVALGLPGVVWTGSSFWKGGPGRVAGVVLAVLLLLNFSGKNLSEVGRLWLPFLPMLLVGVGKGFERWDGDGRDLFATVGLVGLQTLALEATIQVVYPF